MDRGSTLPFDGGTSPLDGARRVSEWVQLIREKFEQTPDLSVTAEQASRIWGIEKPDIEAMLAAFVDARMLDRTRGGAYTRRRDESDSTGTFPLPVRTAFERCARA